MAIEAFVYRRDKMVKGIDKAYYQMATLLDAGIPITRSLQTVASGFRGRLKRVFLFLEDQISCGSQVNKAMSQKRRIFAPLDITMVAAAEESGNLAETFKMLSEWYELQVRIRRKLIGGMAFPVVVFHIGVFAANLTPLFLGKITALEYLQINAALLGWVWGITIALLLFLKIIPKRGIIRLPFDTVFLIIPLLGKALYHLALSRFCHSFYMLYGSGIPIIEAAEMATKLTGNNFVSLLVKGASKSAYAGQPMYQGFNKQLLPIELFASWESGEESGTLDLTTRHLAKLYEDRANHGFDVFVFWLPKIVYGVVAFYLIKMVFRNIGMIYGGIR